MCHLPLGKAVLAAVVGTLQVSLPEHGRTLDQINPINVSLKQTIYHGRSAIQVIPTPDAVIASSYAILKGISFQDGAIEVDLAGKPGPGAGPDARGFIGIAFRLQNNAYEYIYLRPANGRADDQVRRNHSTQYSSYPEFDYARLRRESPEKYESYVDLQTGEWTKFRIVVEGRKARLYIQGAEQPALVVNDLKLEPRAGGVALWVGPGTEGYFSGLKITPKSLQGPASSATADSKQMATNTLTHLGTPVMIEVWERLNSRFQKG